tara:strand:- start:6455 stop:6778 length:324 start_codon:yes stop_codon:yes gene_type:complete
MLLVFSGQVVIAGGVNSCNMEMHQTKARQMSMVDHEGINMSQADMNDGTMDCCDNACAMDCSLSMVSVLFESVWVEVVLTSTTTFILPDDTVILKSITSLYRPPISA